MNLREHQFLQQKPIEVHGYKWPRHPTSVAVASLIDEDEFGRWVGVARGNRWWTADRSRSGTFDQSFVKLVPRDTFWSACFNAVDPVIDVDIVMPVNWTHNDAVLEEIDLELDILRGVDGVVQVRDQVEFDRVREQFNMPSDIVARVRTTCEAIVEMVSKHAEPFNTVGPSRLQSFLSKIEKRS